MRYFSQKLIRFISVAICLFLLLIEASFADEPALSFRLSDGTVLAPETTERLPGVYWLKVPRGTD